MTSQQGLFGEDPIEGPGLEIQVHRLLLDPLESERVFESLMAEISWGQDHITMFGKQTPLPRLTAWFGDPNMNYTYSGIEMHPEPWTPVVEHLRELCNRVASHSFNSALANLYRNGQDGVAWHSDNEVELGPTPVIASLSLGGTRKFQLRRVDNPAEKREIEANSGDLIVMSGLTQQLWAHCVPKTSRHVEPRINLTFRKILTSPLT